MGDLRELLMRRGLSGREGVVDGKMAERKGRSFVG